MEYIKRLFELRHVKVTGIVTGSGRSEKANEAEKKKLTELLAQKYKVTLHIDNDSVLCVESWAKAYKDYKLSGSDASWAQEIMGIIEEIDKNEA
ncbi:MAG: hypothetical protein K5663_03635 [Clostridiales bacterium]|nr:hypothetical protein [Clostridiales bacterium]